MCFLEKLGGCERGTSDGMVEGLGLRLRGRRSSEGMGRFGGIGCFGQEGDLVRDAAAEIAKGLANVGRIVVCFVVVLFAAHVSAGPWLG